MRKSILVGEGGWEKRRERERETAITPLIPIQLPIHVKLKECTVDYKRLLFFVIYECILCIPGILSGWPTIIIINISIKVGSY